MTGARVVAVESKDSAPGAKAEDATSREVLRKILPAAGGSFIEWYEFGIYNYVSLYITDNFFADGRGGSLGTWAAFAITFAFRPLGGACFGYLSDNWGRTPAMRITIGLMLLTTVLQGCLPTFSCCGEAWGWLGLVLFLLCRCLQGLSAGGELSTAAVYISEVSPKEHLGVNLAWLSVCGAFGSWAVAALVVFSIESFISPEDMREWGWRIPYLSSALPGAVLVFFRQYMEETPDFQALIDVEILRASDANVEQGMANDSQQQQQQQQETQPPSPNKSRPQKLQNEPLKEVFRDHKLPMLIGALGCGGLGALWFVPSVYGVQFINEFDGLPNNVVTFAEMICWLVPSVLALPVGKLIDKWGVGKVMFLALLIGGVIAPLPLFYWWAHVPQKSAVAAVFIGQTILGLLFALTTAGYLWLVELFPVRVRTTGVSVAYNIGVGIVGGLGPLVSDACSGVINPRGIASAPALYTTIMSLIGLIALGRSVALSRAGQFQLTHIRPSPY